MKDHLGFRMVARLFAWGLDFWHRWISPGLPPLCRFEPSCSQYAAQALRRHGLWKGGWLSFKRVLRCRPGCPGGHDPVP